MDEGVLSIESHYSFKFLPEAYLSKKIPDVRAQDFFMTVFFYSITSQRTLLNFCDILAYTGN